MRSCLALFPSSALKPKTYDSVALGFRCAVPECSETIGGTHARYLAIEKVWPLQDHSVADQLAQLDFHGYLDVFPGNLVSASD